MRKLTYLEWSWGKDKKKVVAEKETGGKSPVFIFGSWAVEHWQRPMEP